MTFTIRPATAADSEGIRAIRNDAIRNSTALWTSVELDPAQGLAWLTAQIERGTALVAVDPDGQVVGFASGSAWRAYEGYARTCEDSIYLVPGAQGQGLGRKLLNALIDASRIAGDRTMVALIEAGNAASIALHRAAGFEDNGFIPAAGEKFGIVLDLAIMSLRLDATEA